MSLVIRDIELEKGTSQTFRVTVSQPDGSPFDLSGSPVVRWWVLRHSMSEEADGLAEGVTAIDTVEINSQTFYRVAVTFAGVDTDNLQAGHYWHRCKVRKAGNTYHGIVEGQFKLNPSLRNAAFA